MKIHSFVLATLLGVALNSHAGLIHQYELNGSFEDKLGGPSLVPNGGKLVRDDYRFEHGQGLRLDASLGEVYSIDMQFRFNDIGTDWKRILWNGGDDTGFYLSGDKFLLYSPDFPNSGGGAMESLVNTRLTVTRDINKNFKVYQDGTLVLSVLDEYGYGSFMQKSAYFFQDDINQNGRGAVDFIYIYNHALSAGEIGGEPPSPVPEPMPVALLGAGLAAITVTRRRSSWLRSKRNR